LEWRHNGPRSPALFAEHGVGAAAEFAMSPSLPDPFDRFAAQCGLRLTVEALYAAPRDVLHPPAESDQCFLVTLDLRERDTESEMRSLRLVFLVPLADHEPPSRRDVLWWLAVDAWAVDRARGVLEDWAAGYGHPAHDPATGRLFDQHVRQATALEGFLGSERYQQLLALYRAEISPARV
jgi:hypothetical protein